MDLADKVAIVTGGSRGIGRATVLALAEEGCKVSYTYLEQKEKAEGVLGELEAHGWTGRHHQCDVSSFEDAERAVNSTVEEFGRLDILVNNAGVLIPASIETLTDEVWERTFGVNLRGALNMCRHALPHLRRSHGRIVNVSSIAGLMGGVVGVHYAASKAGVLGFTRALAPEVAPDGVLVNSIAPDAVDTDMLLPELRSKVEGLNLLKRVLKPEDVAKGILFLVKTDTLTGQTLNFNAGRYVF